MKHEILVIGATGLIGRACAKPDCCRPCSYRYIAFARKPAGLAVSEVHQWEYQKGLLPAAALSGVKR